MAALPAHIKERLRKLEQRLNEFAQQANKIEMRLNDAAKDASAVRVMRGLEKAAAALEGPIRKALLDNYNTAGIGKSPRSRHREGQGNRQPHGWLKKMIAATSVKLIAKAAYGDNTLIPTFEINLGGPSADSVQRTAAAAINYGAMHVGMTMRSPVNPADMIQVPAEERSKAGAAAKRSLKKMALKGTISKKAYNAIRRGATFEGVQVTRGMDIQRGSRRAKGKNPATNRAIFLGPEQHVWASIPYPFFYFTQAQMQTLKSTVAEAIDREVANGS